MANNWAYLIWIGMMALLHLAAGPVRRESVCGEIRSRTEPWLAVLAFFPIFWGAATRGVWEGDTGAYQSMFEACPSSPADAPAYLAEAARDKGFVLWEILFKWVFGNNFRLFLTVNALFCSAILVKTYRRMSCGYLLSVFLFTAGFEYFQWLYNGMRQFLAVCVVLGCTEDMINGRYRRLILPFLLAASLHLSALVVVPCLYFVRGKVLNRRMALFAAGAVFAGLVLGRTGKLNELIAGFMESTQYDSVLDEFYETMDSGTNALRVLVYSVPAALAVMGRRYILRADDPVIHFCGNMAVIAACVYLISMFTSAIMIGRLPIYFSVYNYILLPWQLQNMFEKRSAKLVTGLLVVCYLAYNYYQVAVVYQQPFQLGFFDLW